MVGLFARISSSKMQVSIFCLFVLPATIFAVPCTDAPVTTEYVPPPINFPRGKYALIRPSTGCPLDWGFKNFFRYWDTEDRYNTNEWSETEHFAGFLKKDGIKMVFCTKINDRGFYDFPAGDYCVIKRGKFCPSGFSEGSIFWDDEDDNNQNAEPKDPKYNPAGIFNENTKIDFCCRDDGPSDQAIKLPIGRAFYLMRYKGPCQQVAEMNVTEEVVQWDDEDDANFNKESGAYPLDTASDPTNHELHFCFYEPQTTGVQ